MRENISVLPTLIAAGILIGVSILYIQGFVSLLIGGFHLVIGAIGYLIFLIVERSDRQLSGNPAEKFAEISKYHRLALTSFLLLFGAATVVSVINTIRPTAYFVLLILGYVLIWIQVGNPPESTRKRAIILGQLILLHVHAALSLSLKYHYYFGNTDTMPHAGNSSNIISATSVAGIEGIYSGFPLWHVLTAISHLILSPGMEVWKTMFLIGACTGIVAILGSYALASRVSTQQNIPYYTALLVSASPTVIFYSAYSIPRSAIVAFLPIIFLALVRFREQRFVWLLLFLLVISVPYHPASPPFVILVLVAVLVLSYVNEMEIGIQTKSYARFVLVTVLFTIGYWIYQSPRLIEVFGALILAATSTGGAVRTATPETPLSQLFDRLYYAPVLMTVLVGMRWLLQNRDRIPTAQLIVGGLGFLFFFVAAPGPLDLIAALIQNFSFARWRTYVFPVILFTAAIGFAQILDVGRREAKVAGAVVLLLLLTPALLGYPVAPDNPAVETERSSSYFTEAETTTLDRALEFSDREVATDLQHRKLLQVKPAGARTATLRYSPDGGTLVLGPEQVGIYRYGEAQDRSLLLQTPNLAEVQVTAADLNSTTGPYNCIYDSGSACIFT